jgi:cell division protein ZapB
LRHYSDGMNSEFHQLSEKINRLAELAQSLRRENAELRLGSSALAAENDDLSRRIEDAHQRVSVLLEKIPAGEQEQESA